MQGLPQIVVLIKYCLEGEFYKVQGSLVLQQHFSVCGKLCARPLSNRVFAFRAHCMHSHKKLFVHAPCLVVYSAVVCFTGKVLN